MRVRHSTWSTELTSRGLGRTEFFGSVATKACCITIKRVRMAVSRISLSQRFLRQQGSSFLRCIHAELISLFRSGENLRIDELERIVEELRTMLKHHLHEVEEVLSHNQLRRWSSPSTPSSTSSTTSSPAPTSAGKTLRLILRLLSPAGKEKLAHHLLHQQLPAPTPPVLLLQTPHRASLLVNRRRREPERS